MSAIEECQRTGRLAFARAMSPLPAPSESALRRALVRAERGVTLDADRGRDAAARPRAGRGRAAGPAADGGRPGARRRAGVGRAARGRHLQPQGVHPAHPPVPRPLPLLHVRDDAGPAARRRARRRSSRPDEVLDIARAGAAMGCKEALFTLGDRPEDRWPVAARVAATRTASTRRWPTCGRWRSGCWRRPGCSRTSTPAC